MLLKPYQKRRRAGTIGPTSRRGIYEGPELSVTGGGVKQLDTTPPHLQRLVRRIGRQRADRAWELIEAHGNAMTAPEAVAYAWLEDYHYDFEFQSSLLGGVAVRGGAVVDFLIHDASFEGIYAWRVQGDHWHGDAKKAATDLAQKDRLLGLWVGRGRIIAVVDLWESDLYDRWPEVLELAIMGEEI